MNEDKSIRERETCTYNIMYNIKNIRPMLSMAQPEDDDHQDDYIIEQSGAKKSWQAQDNIDIQRVTQQAIVSVLKF